MDAPKTAHPWVVAPAGPVGDTAQRRARVRRALWRLALQGVEPQIDPDVWLKEGYLAGPDTTRARGLVRALNSDAPVVWAARGGYGAMRLLAALDHMVPERDRETLFLGFSDITALFPLLKKKGFRCIHGPVLNQASELVERGPAGFNALVSALKGSPIRELSYKTTVDLPSHEMEGPLWGGNLTLCASLVGTPYAPDYTGSIVILEDVGEAAYRLDRMLTQLDLAGVFQAAQAVLVGDLGVRGGEQSAIKLRLEQIQDRWGIPVLTGLPISHLRRNACMELGVPVRVNCVPSGPTGGHVKIKWLG